jgi:hypothetical protein
MTDGELEDLIKFGDETKAFLRGPIGRYLLDRAREEVDAAVSELKAVDPDDVRTIRRLQGIIARNEGVESWLAEIITAANEARDELAGVE